MSQSPETPFAPPKRLQVVAHDLSDASPAQPRIAALVRLLAQLGTDVTLWTEHDPGEWTAALVGTGRLTVRIVSDPVHRTYRWLGAVAGPAAIAPVSPGGSPPPRSGIVRRLWRLGSRLQSAVLFPDPQRLWARQVQSKLLAALRPGDVVLTCSRPESTALVGAAAQRRGARWWLDFADGWCFQGLRSDAMVAGRRREREQRLEREMVARAELVSTVNDELAGYFGALRPGRPVAVYPNIVPDEFAGLPMAASPRQPSALPTLGYFGRLSLSDPERSLAPLLHLLRVEATRPEPLLAHFRFFGVFSARDCSELTELRGLGHSVEVAAPLSRERIAAQRTDFDGALVIGSRHQRGTSSKLLDTLGLGLPVLAFVPVPSAAQALIAETRCGEVIDLANTPDGERWRRFWRGVRGPDYCVDPSVRARYTSASILPEFLARIMACPHAPL